MLLRLTPDQIMKNWPLIETVLNLILPSANGDEKARSERILRRMITEDMHVFASYDKTNGKLEALIITSFVTEQILNIKSLIIYGLYALGKISKDSWHEGAEAIENFARRLGCQRVMAFTNNTLIDKISEKFGYSRESFLSKEVS